MPNKRQPKTIKITTQPGQISSPGGQLTNYLLKNIPVWGNPQWMDAGLWRAFVQKQPIAVLCRDAISNYLTSLDWAIVARDSTQQDELKGDIDYYTRLFERGNAYYSDMDFTAHIEWLCRDLFDLPFGAASEIGREDDSPDGKVVWIRPLDGGTLAPTLNKDYPVIQTYPAYKPVVFPREYISRIYLSPRTEIIREGWGMSPPEKIYLAMEMLNRGDVYYSQLLLNTPEAGILDLGDMEKDSAVEWVNSFRDLLYGINPLKIPVLYEHTTDAKWIPFGKLPNEILYEGISQRYITILTAGYGLSPSDIGFASSSNGGETLSGTIRQERRSARSGKSVAKKKIEQYFENILPESLKFHWIDFDDEKNVAMSRARMANANAFGLFITNQLISPDEGRRQLIADGMMTISIPETLDRTAIEWPTNSLNYVGVKNAKGNTGSNEIGSPKAPSSGGQGESNPQQIVQRSRPKISVSMTQAIFMGNQILGALLNSVQSGNITEPGTIPVGWENKFDDAVIGKSQMDLVSESVIDDTYNTIAEKLEKSEWLDTVSVELSKYIDSVHTNSQKRRKETLLMSMAEQEYIDGTRDDISLTQEELESINKSQSVNYSPQIKRSILERIIPTIILISKSEILGHKFGLDTTDFTDHNNIKLARQVSEKIYPILSSVVDEICLEVLSTPIPNLSMSYKKPITPEDVDTRIENALTISLSKSRDEDLENYKSYGQEIVAGVEKMINEFREDTSSKDKVNESIASLTEVITKASQAKQELSLAPVINVTLPNIDITNQMPEGKEPVVNFSPVINPSEVVVQNNVPIENKIKVDSPINNISVEPTPLEITNQNDITVQPSDVTVIQEKPHVAKVTRDEDGRISKISTEE